MLSQLKKRKAEQGFTIIEVLIVLAIAGLILLVVFLAVPALQRNARNTQRKNDVGNTLSAFSEYVNNNAGALPTSSGACSTAANCPFISNVKLGFYTTANITYTYNATVPGSAPTAPAAVDNAIITNYAKCSGTTATVANATSRSVIALYSVETGGGTQVQCQESGS
ncbi:MAG TPA: type II secretion system protein [Bacillota bacterium]|nr:type II secretion system protein [Bacillota bacterium]